LTLKVYGECSVIYSTSIGPFSTNTTLPNIVINSSATFLSSNVVGTLVKCDNTNVTNGYVILNRNGNDSIFPVTNGAFSFNEIYCSANTQFNLRGIDYDDSQDTDLINYNFDPSPITNVGDIIINSLICNYAEYITYRIDGELLPVVLTENLFFQINSSNVVSIHGYNANGKYIILDGIASGSGVNCLSAFMFGGPDFGNIQSGTAGNSINYNSSPIGAVGTYVDVTFNGTFVKLGLPHTVSGLMHIIRDN